MEDVAQKSAAVLEEYAQAPWVASPGWWFEDHLKYAKASDVADVEPGCQNCRKSPPNMLRCSVCKSYYCDVKCQREAWGKGHKHDCKTIAACNAGPLEKEVMHTVVTESLLRRIRMYLCPYAVGLGYVRGPGFVLLRSNARLEEWVFTTNTNDKGQLLNRNVRLQYLTLGEFDGLAFEDDFELAVIRPSLQKAIEEYDRDTEVLVVVLLSDGLLCGIRLPMVPELKISKSLAVMYDYGNMDGPLQLNVDDDEE